jgi:hypothetical protein
MAGLALHAGFQVFAMVPLHAGQDAVNADPGNGLLLLGKFRKLHDDKLVFGNAVVASPLLAPRHMNWRKNWPVRTGISFICTTRWSPTTTVALSWVTVIYGRCATGNLKSDQKKSAEATEAIRSYHDFGKRPNRRSLALAQLSRITSI